MKHNFFLTFKVNTNMAEVKGQVLPSPYLQFGNVSFVLNIYNLKMTLAIKVFFSNYIFYNF